MERKESGWNGEDGEGVERVNHSSVFQLRNSAKLRAHIDGKAAVQSMAQRGRDNKLFAERFAMFVRVTSTSRC